MAKRKSPPKESVLDQFRVLLRTLRRDFSRLGKKSTKDLPSYLAAVEFAELHKIPGALDLLKAMLLCWQDRDAEALPVLEEATKALPTLLLANCIAIKGVILQGLSRYDEAIECLQKALDTPGYDTPGYALYSMGLAYARKGENDRAIEYYQKALDTPGNNHIGNTLHNLGVAHAQRNELDQAVAYFQKAIDTPGYDTPGEALNCMGSAYAYKGNIAEAAECYQRAIDTPGYDNPGSALHNLALTHVLKHDNDRAIECFQKALDSPDHGLRQQTRVTLANVLRINGQLSEAEAEINKVLSQPDTEGQHSFAKYVLGLIQESAAGLTPTSEEEVLAQATGRQDENSPEQRMLNKLVGAGGERNDEYQKYLQRQASGRDDLFSCLRGWSSSMTLLEGSNDSHWKGGGYFLKWRGHGIVIDPGFDFIDNFHDAGYTGKEIDAVLVSHNHSDHNYDLSSLDDLRYELHRRWKVKPDGMVLRNYLVGLDEDTCKAFEKTTNDFRTLETLDIKKSVRQKWLIRPLGMPMTVQHFPVEHGEDVSHAVGMRLLMHSNSEGKDFIIGYTGDSEYFDVLPSHLKNCDVLLAHISMPDVKELGSDKAAESILKKKHLGYNGLAKLISETKPKLTLVGEFWAGRADIRIELIQGLRMRTGIDAILPTGLGFHLHMPSLEVECTSCRKRVDHSKIKVAPASTPFGPLGYLCGSCIA